MATKTSRKPATNKRTSTSLIKPRSQAEQVVLHLEKNGNITSAQAFKRYGITRLSAIIYNLRSEGLEINNERQSKKGSFGRKVAFDKYVLAD